MSHPRLTRSAISPFLSVLAATGFTAGIVTGLVRYLNQSPRPEAHVPGTAAWPQHLILAAVACVLYVAARRCRGRRPDGGRDLLLLVPIGRTAAARLAATAWPVTWRSAAALPPLGIIAYGFWRVGEQVTGGLNPDSTVNAWGGPTYLGAMACHYLDAALIIAACAWLLNLILVPTATAGRGSSVMT